MISLIRFGTIIIYVGLWTCSAFGIVSTKPFRQQKQLAAVPLPSTSTHLTVISKTFQVYIEDTDTYGVVYNANYLRAYERALQTASGFAATHLQWAILGVDKQKFKLSPKLGGIYVIVSECIQNQNEDGEIWNVVMRDVEDESIVFNSAQCTIGSKLTMPPPLVTKGIKTWDICCPFRDEFEGTTIPIRNQLNFFERARSNFLGGPNVLRTLQEDHGLMYVVTFIDKGALVDSPPYCFGQSVIVETVFVAKRKGMVLECQHTLLLVNENGDKHRIGQAIVTLMALDAETRRPTSDLPEWLRELMELMS